MTACLLLGLTSCHSEPARENTMSPNQTLDSSQSSSTESETTPDWILTPTVISNPRGSLVGAIRWDAWVGDMATFGDASSENRVGLVVERTLGPKKWHYRLPFYALELGENQVQVRGATQEIMDQEITFAANAGLDYWAFVYYPPGSGLDEGRNLYLSSQHCNDINFSLVVDSPGRFLEPETRKLLVDYFRMPNFQKVLDGRPLLYIFGNTGLTREGIDALRADSLMSGLSSPYIVYMGWSPNEVKTNIVTYGLDAGSAYAHLGSNGQPFAELALSAERGWDHDRRAGIKVVLWVTTGWDPRPRVEHPTPWVTYPENQWAQAVTPSEIAAHLNKALQWNAQYPKAAEANAVIIYAWNEFDEGGWLAPTLSEGDARLDAIRSILTGVTK